VKPTGAKLWRLKYRFQAKEKSLSLGAYGDVSLKEAREKRDAARKLISAGVDPSAERQASKRARGDTLEAIAGEWLANQKVRFAPKTYAKAEGQLKSVFPQLGFLPIEEITPPRLLDVLRRIENRANTRPPTASASACRRCSATPSPPAGRRGTRHWTCVAP